MRREVSILVLALTVLACAGGETGVDLGEAQGAAAGYDVLLVTLDTTRADRIGCYGYAAATTPSIDRLAEHGVRVADAVTVAPVTLPAHASILTGRYPPEHGVRDNGEFVLGPDSVTLAETLQASGYAKTDYTKVTIPFYDSLKTIRVHIQAQRSGERPLTVASLGSAIFLDKVFEDAFINLLSASRATVALKIHNQCHAIYKLCAVTNRYSLTLIDAI